MLRKQRAELDVPSVRVPGSTSNLGAGFDCLGLALDFWLEARVASGRQASSYSGTLQRLDPAGDFIAQAIGDRMPHGCALDVRSTIPVSRGLGSSAAARVAGLVLRRLLEGRACDRLEIFEDALVLEGHPDNAGPAVYGGLVLNAGRPCVLTLHGSLGVAIAIPDQEMSTQAARDILPHELARTDAIAQASRSAALALGLTNGDARLVQYGMDDAIAVPRRKHLIAGFDDAVWEGTAAGAFGVTISGAGSAIVAVSRRELASTVATAMADALTAHGNRAAAVTPSVVQGGFQLASPEE
jgi:homoserine kinase